MFKRKTHPALFPAAVMAALLITVAAVVASLTEAVVGMETFL
jgi:hypothetical protein